MNKQQEEHVENLCSEVIDKMFRDFPEYGITPEILPEEIILSENKYMKNGNCGNTTERRLIDHLNSLFQLTAANQEVHLGRKGLNEWLLIHKIQPLLCKFLVLYLNKKMDLDPWTFLWLVEVVDDFLTFCCRKFKRSPKELSREDFSDAEAYQKTLDLFPSKVTKFYLDELYRSIIPFSKIELSLLPKNHCKEFTHPILELVTKELQKKGTTNQSIVSNVVSPMKRFFSWITKVYCEFEQFTLNDIPVWRIQRCHLIDYRSFLLRKVNAGEFTELGAKKHLQYVNGFFKKLYHMEIISSDISAGIPNIKADEYIYRDIPTKEELECFFEVIEKYSDEPKLERLAFGLMLYLGLRGCEVTNLRWEGINIGNRTISFKGKGGGYYMLPMPDVIYHYLMELEVLKKGSVFSDKADSTKTKLYQNFKLYTLVANWKCEGGLHLLRHTFVTTLARNKNCPPHMVQTLARHDSLHSTSKYVHIFSNELSEGINKIHYGGGNTRCLL